MALLTKVGSFAKINTTGAQAVSGLGFQPKAVMFWANSSNLSSGSWKSDMAQMFGFTSGVMESYAVNGHSFDAQATSDSYRRIAAKAVTMAYGATVVECDLSSFDADGFTLNWTANSTTGFLNATNICFMAIGGDDVEAKAINWASISSTGQQSVGGVGFQPSVVLHAGIATLSDLPESGSQNFLSFGVMDENGGQWSNSIVSQDGSSGADTYRYQRVDKCLTSIHAAGGLMGEAEFVSMESDGFTLNWTSSMTNLQFISLCITGVSAKAGSFTKVTTEFPVSIGTSSASTAIAYSNQRKIDRCQNGVMWAAFLYGSAAAAIRFHYSLDGGTTWTENRMVMDATDTWNYTPNFSFFIDIDDYCHLVYKNNYDGFIYYKRGAPTNEARTGWDWSAAEPIHNANTSCNYPDVIAHREGGGWVAHIVCHRNNSTVDYRRVDISSGGAFTVTPTVASGNGTTIGGTYGNTGITYPSIDFHHTGDGKTVASGTPHLYVAWSAGATGDTKGIRFRKATYSAGSWNWSTTGGEKQIATDTFYQESMAGVCMFDGTRVIIVHPTSNFTGNGYIYERDADDTTTTTHTLALNAQTTYLFYGSASYDSVGNVYLIGRNNDETAGTYDLVYRKWKRTGASLGAEVIIDSGVGNPYVSVKRGHSSSSVEFIYTDDTSSPYNVRYGSVDGGAQQAITGIGFQPTALMMSTYANSAGTTIIPDSKWSLGASDGINQRAIYQFDNDTGTTNAKSYFRNDKILVTDASEDSTADTGGSLSSFDIDGFMLAWSPNEAVSYQILYLALSADPETFEGWGVVHI